MFSGVIGSAFDVDPGGTDEPPWGPVLWQVRDPTRSSDGPLIRPLRLDQIVRPLRAHWLDRRKAALQMRIQAAREALAKEGYDPNSAPPVLPHGLDEEELVRAVGWTAYLTAKASFSTTVAIGNALSLPESVVRDRYLTGRARPRNLPQETPGALAQLCTDLAEAPRAPEDWL
ncbi:MAG: hypothetical protein KatS3mg060_2872 [Dehalococcoidia bacterium]|nr:MAG: hypothetical protein KatS3mg060_2872 [Dehalococcoidia bacterium]